MPTVTFILGYCGAGKSWMAERIVAEEAAKGNFVEKFDEGFLNLDGSYAKYDSLIAALNADRDCVVIEIAYVQDVKRSQLLRDLERDVPKAAIRWLCFDKTEIDKANKNCRERRNKGDPEGHVRINDRVNSVYSYPVGAVILTTWTREQ